MAIITIDGQIGAGAPDVGRQVARILRIDYYDRLLLSGVAKTIGATVAAVQEKEQRLHRFSDRIRAVFERALQGLAMGAGVGDPYFGSMYLGTLPLTWDESPMGPKVRAFQVDNREYARATSHQIREIATCGNAVIVHRAGCVELRDEPKAFRVGLFALERDRVWRVMTREGFLRPEDARHSIAEREKSQIMYFQQNYGVHPHDESLYDLRMTTSTATSAIQLVALKIIHAVRGEVIKGVTVI